jgi:hypothetical protein
MLTLALLFAAPAHAGDIVVITANPHARDLTDYDEPCDCEEDEADCEHEDDDDWDGPEAAVVSSSHGGSQLRARYAMHFLPEAPAHYVGLRHTGEKDAYLNGELRYLPASDLLWTGRAGAGVDVLGGGNWDLTVGLFIGTNGEWERSDQSRILYAAPMGGTEIGFGIEGDRIFAKYRWLAGLGTGPLDDALTENELTVGYKLNPTVHLFGQWIRVNPGDAETSGGIGIGAQAVF